MNPDTADAESQKSRQSDLSFDISAERERIENVMKVVTTGDIDRLKGIISNDGNEKRDSDLRHAMRAASEHGQLDCVQLLHEKGVSLDWAPHFAATNGHINILEYIKDNSDVLEDMSRAQETACYALEVGRKPEAALWLFDQGRVSSVFVMQAAIRSGRVDVIDEVYRHFYKLEEVLNLDIDDILQEAFPFVWIHAICDSKRMCNVVEYLLSISSQALENHWQQELFHRNRKRMRLASTIGRMSDMYAVQEAFNRGVARKQLVQLWSDLSIENKRVLIGRLMGVETTGRLEFLTSIVSSFLGIRRPVRSSSPDTTRGASGIQSLPPGPPMSWSVSG